MGSGSPAKRPAAKRPAATSTSSGVAGSVAGSHRRQRQARRLPVAVAAIIALTIVGTSFPLTALLHGRSRLAAASAQLAQVNRVNARLTEQEQQLNAKTEIRRLAREDYQLVQPGQTLFNVLPAPGRTSTSTGNGVTPSAGDPANQPLVSPSNAPDMSPDPGLPTGKSTGGLVTSGTASSGSASSSAASSSAAGTAGVGSFWHRVTSTLQFWR